MPTDPIDKDPLQWTPEDIADVIKRLSEGKLVIRKINPVLPHLKMNRTYQKTVRIGKK